MQTVSPLFACHVHEDLSSCVQSTIRWKVWTPEVWCCKSHHRYWWKILASKHWSMAKQGKKERELNSRHAAIFNRVCYGQSPGTKSVLSIHFSQPQREANWCSRCKARENMWKKRNLFCGTKNFIFLTSNGKGFVALTASVYHPLLF